MVRERVFESEATTATEALGEQLGRLLGPGDVIALQGDLGSGKTAFARGVARGLGVSDPVHSPTFALLHEYEGRIPVYHFDAWMDGREVGFLESGGALLLGGDGVSIVEWADRIRRFLPAEHLVVAFSHLDESRRGIRVILEGGVGPGHRLWDLLAGLRLPRSGIREIGPRDEPPEPPCVDPRA